MEQSNRRPGAAQQAAATSSRNFRTFLLVQQLAAKEIGARIKQARRERGIASQEDLAAMASFSKRSLQDYETGVTIPYRHLRELSHLLGRPEEWFLYGDEPVSSDRLESIEEQLIRIASEIAALRNSLEEAGLCREK
jgi:transcriptional regulator with XRE-family HTH domain